MLRNLKTRHNDRKPIVTRPRRLLISTFRVYAVIPSNCIVFNSSVDVQRLWCTMRKYVMAAKKMATNCVNSIVSINGKRFLKGIAFSNEREFWGLVCRVISGSEPLMINGVQFKHITRSTYSVEEANVMRMIFS